MSRPLSPLACKRLCYLFARVLASLSAGALAFTLASLSATVLTFTTAAMLASVLEGALALAAPSV